MTVTHALSDFEVGNQVNWISTKTKEKKYGEVVKLDKKDDRLHIQLRDEDKIIGVNPGIVQKNRGRPAGSTNAVTTAAPKTNGKATAEASTDELMTEEEIDEMAEAMGEMQEAMSGIQEAMSVIVERLAAHKAAMSTQVEDDVYVEPAKPANRFAFGRRNVMAE
jgi:hypothetical protein